MDLSDSQRLAVDYLRGASVHGAGLRPKRSLVAGVLAAVIPGSGRAYVDGYKEGLYSLLVIGVTGGMAYRFAVTGHEKAAIGWGLPFAGFYFGEIYGSVARARHRNRTSGADHYHRIHEFARTRGWLPSPYLHRQTFELLQSADEPGAPASRP